MAALHGSGLHTSCPKLRPEECFLSRRSLAGAGQISVGNFLCLVLSLLLLLSFLKERNTTGESKFVYLPDIPLSQSLNGLFVIGPGLLLGQKRRTWRYRQNDP